MTGRRRPFTPVCPACMHTRSREPDMSSCMHTRTPVCPACIVHTRKPDLSSHASFLSFFLDIPSYLDEVCLACMHTSGQNLLKKELPSDTERVQSAIYFKTP